MRPPRAELRWAVAAAFFALTVYLLTLCPTVNFIDSGELAAVATTLGVAHPTGYPLFTLTGWVFAHLPLGLRVITKLNVMSAVFCSLGLVFYFKFMSYLLASVFVSQQKDKQSPPNPSMEIYLPALAGTLLLAFSRTYWTQGIALEVYSLHVFFVGLLLFLFGKALIPVIQKRGEGFAEGRHEPLILGLFSFVLGLSFTNHMTTIFLAPAFLYLFAAAHGFTARAWKRILWMAVPFLLGLSMYAYLPLRASEHPALNWGNPVSWEAFFRHTSAKQYSVWLFSSAGTAKRQLGNFLSELPAEFTYAGLALAAVGIWSLFRRHRRLFLFTALLFIGCVLYAVNYDIHDIDSYFLLAYATVGIWAACGARQLISAAATGGTKRAVAAAALLCAGLEGGVNAPAVTLHDMHLVEDYTRDMFRSVAPDAVVITYQWDYFVSASYYAQQVEGVRPDVVVIDKELLRRTWYFAQLERQHPWLIARSRAEVDAYMVELRKFERDLPYNPQVIEYRFAALIRSFIDRNLLERPVYVTPEIEPQYTLGFRRTPSGLAERLSADAATDDAPEIEFQFRIPARRDAYVDGVTGLYAQAYLRAAAHAAGLGRGERARALAAKALETEPGMPEALRFLDQLKEEVKGGG